MAFNRPTLQELVSRVEADLTSRLQITGALARRAMVRVLGRVWAGSAHSVHGHIVWASKQMLASTAEAEQLERFGAELGVDRKAAAWAAGNVTFTGTSGSVIPAGTIVQRQDGVQYETQADMTIASGSATAEVKALVAGSDGNADATTSVSLISPILGVQSTAAVAAGGITDGTDIESDDDYRARILQRKRQPPQGGSRSDYERWTLEVPGITRVWVYPGHMGLGTVGVTFVLDGESNIVPDAAKVAEVQAYLDDPARKPITADVVVFAPVTVPLNLTIDLEPNTVAVQNAVTAELRDLLLREGAPGATVLVSHIREAISIASGETNHALISPVADIVYQPNQIPILGAITWQ